MKIMTLICYINCPLVVYVLLVVDLVRLMIWSSLKIGNARFTAVVMPKFFLLFVSLFCLCKGSTLEPY